MRGPISVGEDDFTIRAEGGPAGRAAMLFYGPEAVHVPFAGGLRCVGAGALGLFRVPGAATFDGSGRAEIGVSFRRPPADAGPGEVRPGAVLGWQAWYRDPAGGGSNFSDALWVRFLP